MCIHELLNWPHLVWNLGSLAESLAAVRHRQGLLTERMGSLGYDLLNRLLDDFEGKLTTSKYAALAKCSQDTAFRDILSMIDSGLLVRNPAGGRSTSYALAETAAGR